VNCKLVLAEIRFFFLILSAKIKSSTMKLILSLCYHADQGSRTDVEAEETGVAEELAR
jgi:hypothetical protein